MCCHDGDCGIFTVVISPWDQPQQPPAGGFWFKMSETTQPSLREMNGVSTNDGDGHESTGFYSPHEVNKIRRRLKFFFMNPCEKWKARKRLPWKLVLQLAKIVLVTVQLAVFGNQRSRHVNFLEKSNLAFKHIYLKEWNPSYETMPYQPAYGQYAVYTIPEFYDHLNFALLRYNETETLAIGTYQFSNENNTKPPMMLCVTQYAKGEIQAWKESYVYDSKHIKKCMPLDPAEVPVTAVIDKATGQTKQEYDIKGYVDNYHNGNDSIHFDKVIRIELRFTLKTVHLKSLSRADRPDCYLFKIKVLFDNSHHDGQVLVTLKSDVKSLTCRGKVTYQDHEEAMAVGYSIFDSIVIAVSFLSFMLCMRSIIQAQKLKMHTLEFFKRQHGMELTTHDKLEFLNMWYVLIILNDILTIAGSVFKIGIETKIVYNYEACGVLLGTGNLLVWFGVLRYLGYFEKYNILILTMKSSAPSILRFLVCAGVFYAGFAFCGWVVLGPYHIKFRDLSTASECLFSLINGDDMFVTFSAIPGSNSYVWWYSQIYLYTFISLFIYVILNVFISVIMDTYEAIKYYHQNGFPKSDMHKFIDQCQDSPSSPLYRSDDWYKGGGLGCCPLSCCQRTTTDGPTEYTSLVS